MPSTATEELVVCWMSHSRPPGVVKRGERLRKGDPAVVNALQFFVAAGTPEREWPTPFDRAVEENELRQQETRDELLSAPPLTVAIVR